MSYAQAQHFIEEARLLDAEDKIKVITILLDSLAPPAREEMDDDEAMRLFNHFTGRLSAPSGFDIKKAKVDFLDERYGG